MSANDVPYCIAVYASVKERIVLRSISDAVGKIGVDFEYLKVFADGSHEANSDCVKVLSLISVRTEQVCVLVCGRDAYEPFDKTLVRSGLRSKVIFVSFDHGIAPFKVYSYAEHFIKYDYYLGTTQFIVDRLKQLFPLNRNKFLVGGFPRLDMLYSDIGARKDLHGLLRRYYFGTYKGRITLALFSWGVKKSFVEDLPDREGVVYLFHPSEDRRVVFGRPWNYAVVAISNRFVVPDLLSIADEIYGDLSSLTMEASQCGKTTYMMLDKGCYIDGYDVDDDSFVPGRATYGLIPSSRIRIEKNQLLSGAQLIGSLSSGVPQSEPLQLPEVLLAPVPGRNSEQLCCALMEIFVLEGLTVSEVAGRDLNSKVINESQKIKVGDIVSIAYFVALGRGADSGGLEGYIRRFSVFEIDDDEAVAHVLRLILCELWGSVEGKKILDASPNTWLPNRR